MKASLLAALLLISVGCSKVSNTDGSLKSSAPAAPAVLAAADAQDSALDDLDPFDPNIEAKLQQMDKDYEQATGLSAHLPEQMSFFSSCSHQSCPIYARVEKSEQRMYLYVNGSLYGIYATSTGIPGRDTPNLDTHPDGRIYDRYTSTKFPGGDYDGMGNMPYAVFIRGGVAIHGTGRGNWPKLGHRASHGCVRIHPDNALIFNRLVRQYGASQTWVTIE